MLKNRQYNANSSTLWNLKLKRKISKLRKINPTRVFLIFITILLFQSCTQEPKIEITKEYISNKHWNKYNNAILIEKMKVKKGGTLDPTLPDFDTEIRSYWDLNDKLEVDSTFMYSYTGLNYKKDLVMLEDKVFFNKDNGFYWNFGNTYFGNKKTNKKTIGSLENNTWYKFSHLKTINYYVYVFIDSNGVVHRFNVNMSNF